MYNQISVPQSLYVVFELVKINIDNYVQGNYVAEQVQTVYLAVLPQQFSYRLISRDYIQQTDEDVFVNKFGMAPERCTISGNFGIQRRFVAGTYMDGWSRLRQFEEEIVRRSKEIGDADERYIYALNYYDFIWRRFGSINVQSFHVSGDARENNQLPRYSCDFVIVGDLIMSTSSDEFLNYVNAIYGKEGLLEKAVNSINGILQNKELNSALHAAAIGSETLASMGNALADISGFVKKVKSLKDSKEILRLW